MFSLLCSYTSSNVSYPLWLKNLMAGWERRSVLHWNVRVAAEHLRPSE